MYSNASGTSSPQTERLGILLLFFCVCSGESQKANRKYRSISLRENLPFCLFLLRHVVDSLSLLMTLFSASLFDVFVYRTRRIAPSSTSLEGRRFLATYTWAQSNTSFYFIWGTTWRGRAINQGLPCWGASAVSMERFVFRRKREQKTKSSLNGVTHCLRICENTAFP